MKPKNETAVIQQCPLYKDTPTAEWH